jgi:hypothetical protein
MRGKGQGVAVQGNPKSVLEELTGKREIKLKKKAPFTPP